jgi:predicted TIM-barrel fold metal-dependent hydrolase
MSSFRLVSSDSHIMEPPDLWENRIDSAYKDRAPHIVREDGYDQWYADGNIKFGVVGSNTQAGRRFDAPETIQTQGTYEDVLLGGMDPHAHVKDLDIDTVHAGVIYPSMGLTIWRIPSSDLLSACFRAYNDWLADFCAPYPNRLKGIAMLNVDSVEDGVGELKRAKEMGLAGGMIPQRPVFGRYDSPMYEPLWEASTDLDMPLAIHIGCSRWTPSEGAGAVGQSRGAGAGLVEFTNQEYDMKDNIASIIYSGVFERHPNLKIGLVEYEVSWAPYLLYRMDRHYEERPAMFEDTRFKGDMIPSDFFKRNVYLSFQEDPVGIQLREYVGVETLMWGSDYPHAESTFPKSREIVDRILEGVPEEEKVLIAGENCAKMFNVT